MGFFRTNTSKPEPKVAPEVLPEDVQEHLDELHTKDIARKFIDPGVARIEAVNSVMTLWDKIFVSFWVLLCAYSYGLDTSTRNTYQTFAANSFDQHSLSSTVNVARGATSAAAQLLSARLSDIFGRVEIVITAVVFYVVGTAIEAAADDIATFTGGSVMYSIGRTMLQLSMEVIVSDISTLRWRTLFALIPTWPVIINTWVSGNVTQAVLGGTTWKWGVGMWCVIVPVLTLPLVIHLYWIQYRARKAGKTESYKDYYSVFAVKSSAWELFWLLDLLGIFFMLCVLCLILIPLTLAGGERRQWTQARILAPLCIGCGFIPVFCIYEYFLAPHPLVPVKKFKSRGVWPGLVIGFFLDLSSSLQADYLLTVLMVAFNFSQKMSTRITSLFSFCNFTLSTLLSLFIFRFRRVKFAVVLGTATYVAAFGILIHYRGSPDGQSGIIGGEILLGFGGAGFAYPVQSLMQAWVPHDLLATVTATNWALYQVGSAVGGSVSGAIWTQVLPNELNRRMTRELADAAYAAPLTFIKKYAFGTPERQAMVAAYQHIQWLLCVTGIALAAPMFIAAIIIRRAILNDHHSLVNRDMKFRFASDDDSSENIGIDNGKENEKTQVVGAGSSDTESLKDPETPHPHSKFSQRLFGDLKEREDNISRRAKNSKFWKVLDFMI